MNYEQIKYEIQDGILTITLNRPDKLNAFTGKMLSELLDAMDRSDRDDDVRAVVFTGAGRGFCAGADLSGGANTFNAENRGPVDPGLDGHRDGGGLFTLRAYESLKPTIAACNGPAVGVGVTMQLPMDIRLASTEARYGFVFGRRGLVMEACSSWFLPRLVGMPTALDWVYSGRVFNADEALASGLVQSLHAPEDLLPAAIELAHKVTRDSAPVSIALARQMLWRGFGANHPMEGHIMESRALASRGAATDTAEGVTAFKEKRDAVFPNHVSTDYPDLFDPEPEFR